MKYRFLILNICLLFLHISCEEELQVPVPEEQSKLVINSLMGVDSLLRVHVGKSSVFQEGFINPAIENAEVQIKQNNQILGNMSHESAGWYVLNNNYLTGNSDYQIEVSHPDYETVNAQTEVLEKVDITGLTYQKSEDDKLDFTLQFQDNALQENYYMILLRVLDETSSILIDYNSDDIVFNGNLSLNPIGLQQNMLRDSHTFSDENFNGNQIDMSFFIYVPSFTEVFNTYQVELYHITQDYFKYERSLVAFKNREDLPFYKKVNLHSNVSGGYGIFTSYALDSRTIKID